MAKPDFQIGRTLLPEEALRIPEFANVGQQRIGKELEGLGEAGQKLAKIISFKKAQSKDWDAQKKFMDFQLGENERLIRESNALEDSDAAEFKDTFATSYKKNEDKFLETVDPIVRDQYAAKAAAFRNDLSNRALLTELKTRHNYHVKQIGEAINKVQGAVNNDPDKYDEYLQNLDDLVDKSDMSTGAKVTMKKAAREKTELALLNWEIQNDMETAKNAMGIKVKITNPAKLNIANKIQEAAMKHPRFKDNPDYVKAVAYSESKLNPYLENPLSSAKGVFQLLNKQDPQWAIDKTRTQDLDKQIEYGLKALEENISGAEKALGRKLQPREWWIAHILGPSAAYVLSGDPNASWVETLNQKAPLFDDKGIMRPYGDVVYKYNPYLRSAKTNQGLAVKLGNAVSFGKNVVTGVSENNIPDPKYDNIPYETRLQKTAEIEERDKRNERALYERSGLELKQTDEVMKQATDLKREGKLNWDFVTQYRSILSDNDYRVLENMIKNVEGKTDKEVYARLLPQAYDRDTDLESFRSEIRSEFLNGRLDFAHYDRLMSISYSKVEAPETRAKRGMIVQVGKALEFEKSKFNATQNEAMKHMRYEYQNQMEEYLNKNPNASWADTEKFRDELIERAKGSQLFLKRDDLGQLFPVLKSRLQSGKKIELDEMKQVKQDISESIASFAFARPQDIAKPITTTVIEQGYFGQENYRPMIDVEKERERVALVQKMKGYNEIAKITGAPQFSQEISWIKEAEKVNKRQLEIRAIREETQKASKVKEAADKERKAKDLEKKKLDDSLREVKDFEVPSPMDIPKEPSELFKTIDKWLDQTKEKLDDVLEQAREKAEDIKSTPEEVRHALDKEAEAAKLIEELDSQKRIFTERAEKEEREDFNKRLGKVLEERGTRLNQIMKLGGPKEEIAFDFGQQGNLTDETIGEGISNFVGRMINTEGDEALADKIFQADFTELGAGIKAAMNEGTTDLVDRFEANIDITAAKLEGYLGNLDERLKIGDLKEVDIKDFRLQLNNTLMELRKLQIDLNKTSRTIGSKKRKERK